MKADPEQRYSTDLTVFSVSLCSTENLLMRIAPFLSPT